jgi:hypothetical protein
MGFRKNLVNLLLASSIALAGCGDSGGGSGSSSEGEDSEEPVPDKPRIVEFIHSGVEPQRNIQLLIQDNSDNERGFVLERGSSTESGYTQLADISSQPGSGTRFVYNDRDVEKSTIYFYQIRAYNESGSSEWEEKSTTSLGTLVGVMEARATKDSYVQKTFPNANYGNLPYIYVSYGPFGAIGDEIQLGFLYFPLPTLPPYAIGFNSAELRLREAGGGNTNYPGSIKVLASPVIGDWEESTIGYTNRPGSAYSALITGHGEHNPNVFNDRTLNIDVSGMVREWYAGIEQNKGLILLTTDEGKYCAYYSREAGTPSSPLLTIKYNW